MRGLGRKAVREGWLFVLINICILHKYETLPPLKVLFVEDEGDRVVGK